MRILLLIGMAFTLGSCGADTSADRRTDFAAGDSAAAPLDDSFVGKPSDDGAFFAPEGDPKGLNRSAAIDDGTITKEEQERFAKQLIYTYTPPPETEARFAKPVLTNGASLLLTAGSAKANANDNNGNNGNNKGKALGKAKTSCDELVFGTKPPRYSDIPLETLGYFTMYIKLTHKGQEYCVKALEIKQE